MNQRTRRRRRQSGRTADNRKLSEMIWEFSGDFIDMGETQDERESLLNAACSAWNIACAPLHSRKRQIDHYANEYLKFNPDADDTEIAGVRSNLEKLIEKKLEMFPSDRRQIIDARMIELAHPAPGLSGQAHRRGHAHAHQGADRLTYGRFSVHQDQGAPYGRDDDQPVSLALGGVMLHLNVVLIWLFILFLPY